MAGKDHLIVACLGHDWREERGLIRFSPGGDDDPESSTLDCRPGQ
jgi:hypothetical protein